MVPSILLTVEMSVRSPEPAASIAPRKIVGERRIDEVHQLLVAKATLRHGAAKSMDETLAPRWPRRRNRVAVVVRLVHGRHTVPRARAASLRFGLGTCVATRIVALSARGVASLAVHAGVLVTEVCSSVSYPNSIRAPI